MGRTALALVLVCATVMPARAEGGVWTTTYPSPNVGMSVGGMHAFRDGTVVALHGVASRGGPVLLRSADFGRTWSERPGVAHGLELHGLAMSSPRAGWAVGTPPADPNRQRTPYDGGLLRTTDGTTTWRQVRLARAPGARRYLLNVVRTSPSGRSAVVTGRTFDANHRLMPGSDVIWVTDDGRTQRRVTLGETQWGFSTASVLDDRTAAVFVAEYHPSSPWTPGTPCCPEYKTSVHVTRDAGRTWTRTMRLDDEIASADWVAPDWLAVASLRHGTIYVSRDGARRFGRVGAVRLLPPGASDDGTHPPAVQIDYVDKRVAYANACQAGMWRTTNGGESWDLEPSPNHGDVYAAPFCSLNGIAAGDADHAVSIYPGGLIAREP